MGFELNILDWFQTLHTPVLDKFMTSVTKLGNAGIFWIILTVLIFLIDTEDEKNRCESWRLRLIIDLLLCNVLLKNLVARTRPYDVNTGSTAYWLQNFAIIHFRLDIQRHRLHQCSCTVLCQEKRRLWAY